MELAKIAKKIKEPHKKNIALIGHMGSGKSLLGKIIAKKIAFKHLDSDTLIEQSLGKKINKIFEDKGEKFFRKIEENIIIDKFSSSKNVILSLGGGSILSNKVRKLISKKFLSFFLDVEISLLAKRLKKTQKRPLLKGVNIEKKLKELDVIRRKYYLLSDIVLKEHSNIYKTLKEFEKKYINFYEKRNSD